MSIFPPKQRPFLGSAVKNKTLMFTSISQVVQFDHGTDGCNRRWFYTYVRGLKEPKTAKQMEQFSKTAEIRRNNVAARKQAALLKSAELLISTTKQVADQQKPQPVVTASPAKKQVVVEQSDSDEEIIIVKSKPKKKVRKIIIEDSSSSDDDYPPTRGGPSREAPANSKVSVQRQTTFVPTRSYFF